MNKKSFSKNIAESLSNTDWSADAVERILSQRLPSNCQKHSQRIAHALIARLPSSYAPRARAIARALTEDPLFDRVYKQCQKHNTWPGPVVSPANMTPIRAFADLDLPRLSNLEELSDWLLTPQDRLDYLADRHRRYEEHDEMAVNHYVYHILPKKKGRHRVIEAPKLALKSLQIKILHDVLDRIPNHQDAFGFVKGRNCLDGANRHSGEQVVLRFDLRDYFPSIAAKRVFGLFRCLGYPSQIAQYLTSLSTTATPSRILERLAFEERALFRQPHLPQGAPTSPALANHLSFNLDRRLSALARKVDMNYSRYADDITFSGDHDLVGVVMRAVPEIIQDEGFFVNEDKTRVVSNSSHQTVTGIVVNQHLNVNRRYFDNLKAVIHRCRSSEDQRIFDKHFVMSLVGKINWVETVNPAKGQKLRRLFEKMVEHRQGHL